MIDKNNKRDYEKPEFSRLLQALFASTDQECRSRVLSIIQKSTLSVTEYKDTIDCLKAAIIQNVQPKSELIATLQTLWRVKASSRRSIFISTVLTECLKSTDVTLQSLAGEFTPQNNNISLKETPKRQREDEKTPAKRTPKKLSSKKYYDFLKQPIWKQLEGKIAVLLHRMTDLHTLNSLEKALQEWDYVAETTSNEKFYIDTLADFRRKTESGNLEAQQTQISLEAENIFLPSPHKALWILCVARYFREMVESGLCKGESDARDIIPIKETICKH